MLSVMEGAGLFDGDMFFFFKQKTAYEVLRSRVGSEMCIRDSIQPTHLRARFFQRVRHRFKQV